MREILFRGKRIDNGAWVYGDLLHNDNTHFPMVLIGYVVMSRDKHFSQDLNFDGYSLCEVDPETVGQFTGLTDKNGNKIFEGDTIKARFVDLGKPYQGIVIFADGLFCVKGKAGYPAIDLLKDYEIIGQEPPKGE